VLIPRQAAHGRCVQAQSRRAAHLTIHHSGEHLALQTREWRAPAEVQMRVKTIEERAQLKVDESDAKDTWDDTAVATPRDSEDKPTQATRLIGSNRSDAHQPPPGSSPVACRC
jgi:hypothetical protein